MKKGKLKTKGQMRISFGMIFSIILIILFITFAVYGIKKFMEVTDFTKVEKFKNDFQVDINNMWKSTQGSQEVEYLIPKKISEVCFEDDEFENMYFIPSDYGGDMLKNIDIGESVKGSKSNPKKLCIETSGGKISLIIKKDYNENLVTVGGENV